MKRLSITHYFEEIGTIEVYTKKEILPIIEDYINNIESLDDENIFIQYKNGKYFHLIGKEHFGTITTFKKGDIEKVIIDNGSTFQVWGKYQYHIEGGCLFVE